MCTRTKRVPYLWSFVHHIYRRGEDFQRSMCKRRASGRHEEKIRYVTSSIGTTVLYDTHDI